MKSLISRMPSALTALTALIFLGSAAPHPASAQNAAPPGGLPHRLSAKTLSQIAALEAEADARTPTEQKISSQLLYSLKMLRGQQIAPGIAIQRTTTTLDGAGFTLVDIDGSITPALQTAIQRVGGQVIGGSVWFGQLRARIPLSAVEFLASLPEVRFIKPAVMFQLQNPAPVKANGLMQRKAEVQAHLPVLLAQADQKILGINFTNAATQSAVGSVTDEGDKTHQADTARSTYHIDGTGIKVGVLSDSVDNGNGAYNAAVSSGDVSPVTVISGQAGPTTGEGEGLAMLEVVHHLAPGAQLYFATGDNGQAQFADNIIALQQAGCKVIIDDIAYTDESPFQDDIIAQAINTVTANGAMYFSCAANYGNADNSTASVWEGDFSSSGDTSSGDGVAHQFDTSGTELNGIQTGSQTTVSLFWSDPLGKSSNDYDLFIVDSNLNIVASSTNRQTGSQDPYEQATASNGDSVAIVLHSGATRYLHVDLDAQNSQLLNYYSTGRTRGHNAAANAFCVAATPATTGSGGNPPNGPYPNPFNTSDVVEPFSDDGPRHIFYNPDGSAITSDLTHTGGKFLAKPDFTAADGTSSTLPLNGGLNPFFGTSCAAPHAGAIAALVLSYNKSLTRAQLSSILQTSATDIMASGYDRDAGYGILNAYKSLQNTPAPTTNPTLASLTFSPTSGFGGSATTTGTVTLTKAATATTTVTLSSSDSTHLVVPASVSISTGSTSATFTGTSHTVTTATTVTVTASYSGVSKTATFTANPTYISSVAFNPASVTGGSANSTGTVTLAGAVGSALTVTLTSSNTAALTVPASISIPYGTTSGSFTATSHTVTTATTVTVTASYNGGSKTATVTVNPATSSVTPKTLTFNPNPAYSNSLTTGTVTLTAAAPTGGTAVTINSVSGTTKTALVTVTVPAGQTTMTFSLRVGYVSATTTYNYSADANGGSAPAALTLKPTTVMLTSFTMTPNPVSSSGFLTATVTLSAAAPTGGAAMSFRLNGVFLGLLTVPAGSTTRSITLFPAQVTTSTAETYTAYYNNVTKNIVVTVNP